MSKRLIYAEDAIEALCKAGCESGYCGISCDDVKAIEQLPSAQPEIIRCKDCKYAEVADQEDSQDGYTCQFHRGSIWFSGCYCSFAERKDDDKTNKDSSC